MIIQMTVRRHESIIGLSFHHDVALDPIQYNTDQFFLGGCHPLGIGQGRETVVVTFSIALMAGHAISVIEYPATIRVSLLYQLLDRVGVPDIALGLLSIFHGGQFGWTKFVFLSFIHDSPNLSLIGFADIDGSI